VAKTCQCGAGDALNLGVSNHVKDAEGNWTSFAVTGSGIAASGDKCPSGDSSSADSIYCTWCDSTSGLYLLKDASGNVKTWNDSTGFVHNITVCHVCQEPYHSNSSGNHQSECSVKTCDIGYGYPTSLSADFSNLPDQFGQSDVLSCAQCDVGRFSEVDGVGGCFRMGSGYECKTRLGTEGYDHTVAAKLGCSETKACDGGSYKFDEDMAGVSKLSQTCNKVNAGFYCNAIAHSDVTEAGALLLSGNTVHVNPEPFGVCEESESASRRRLDSHAMSGGGQTHATASHPCQRIHDSTRCAAGAYNPTTKTKHACTWTDTSSNTGLHAASTALGSTEACAMEAACPVGYYSNKGDGYCTKIPDGHRCKKARAGDSMCATPDQVIGAGTAMQTYCGVYDATTNSYDWQYLTHGDSDHDLSVINSQAIELGCAEIEKCPKGMWSNTGDYNCLEIPAGQKCSANADGSNITATSVGCKEVEDCGSLEYSAEETNICQTFSGCPVGERVDVAGVSGGVTWGTDGARTDFAGRDNTCEVCVTNTNHQPQSAIGFNTDDDDDGSVVTDCTTWSGCAAGEALTGTVGDGSNDNGACTDCDANGVRKFAAVAVVNGLTQTTCTTANACNQNGEKPIACTNTACPCGACDAGQSGLVENGAGVCTDCVSGRFSAAAGNGTCTLCGPGKFTAATKQTSCSSYDAGEGCTQRATGSGTEDGCKLIENCPKGTYSGADDSECKDIPAGYQCTALSSGSQEIGANSEKCASIDKCTVGSYSLVKTNVCVSIPAGKKCSANVDGSITPTSVGCTAITVCEPYEYSLVNVNECVAFSACSAGDYVKTAPGGDSTNGYTTDRECEQCNDLGAFYRTGTPAIGQLTADSTATTCYACTVCGQNGAAPVETQACSATQNAECRAVNANADDDCSGQCDNGNDVCTAYTNPKTAMTCGQCHDGYSGSTCAPITCTCTNGSPVTTSDTDTCINSNNENCDSCHSGHNLVDGVSPNGKICSAVECSCAGGIAKSIAQGCTDIDDTSGPDNCQNCTAGYGFATVSGRSTCTQCAAHEYADAGTNACAAKSFKCTNGTKYADATDLATHSGVANGAENCETCKAGFYLDQRECKVCGPGKHTDQDNKASTCDDNVCTCSNGQEAAQGTSACVGDNDAICVSCTAGLGGTDYELNGATCVACSAGKISNGGDAGTSDGCGDKKCTCNNGALDGSDGATGTDCDNDGDDICKSNANCNTPNYTPVDVAGVRTCIAKCGCDNGTGETGTTCHAAGTKDCASCNSGYGRYLKEGAATDEHIHVCEKCLDFGDAFSIGANSATDSTGFCALDSCPAGQGYNLPTDLTSSKFLDYVADFESNTFRGAALIEHGDFKCTDCPANQYSNDTARGQCEAIASTEVCVTYRSTASVSGTGCEKICTTQDNAATYNATDCSIASCKNTHELVNGACEPPCATGTQRHATDGTCRKDCPVLTTGGNGTDTYEADTPQNCRTATQIQGATCDVTCTATNRTATDAELSCAQGADATTDGTWSAGPTCLLVNGQPCTDDNHCESDHCHNNECEN